MKMLAKLSTALVAALALASTLAWSGPGNGAVTQWERDSFQVDNPGLFIPCLGEEVRFFGEVPYKRHTVTSASGNTSYHFQLTPVTPNQPPFTGVGNVSGTVWHYQNGLPINESFHLGPGEVLNVQVRESYYTDNGDRLTSNIRIHFTTNAGGELVVSREFLEWTCR